MTQPQRPPRGRGTASNPHNRFAATRSEAEHDGWYEEATPLTFTTSVRRETAKTVISRNQSPDVGFDRSVNPYRGCEHGCLYSAKGTTQALSHGRRVQLHPLVYR